MDQAFPLCNWQGIHLPRRTDNHYEDNQGAIEIADDPTNHPKTKHIAVQYHAVRNPISNGEVRLEPLATDPMIADGLTKATNHVSQGRLVDDLGLA